MDAEDGCEGPRGLPDFFETIGLHIVSARLGQVLQSLGAEIELWPASVAYGCTAEPDGYYAVNPLRQLSALDMTQSSVKLDELGLALSVKRAVLDEGRLANAQWVKVRELQRVAVSPAAQAALVDSGFTGFQFVDPRTSRI